MALVYNQAKADILSGAINLSTDTLKVILVSNVYVANADHTIVDAGGASDVVDAEINVTGYVRGWGGAGRKALGSKTFTPDMTNDRAALDAGDLTWPSLGAGATIVAAVLVKEGGANDTTSKLIAYLDFASTATNGGDFTIQWDATGILRLA